MAMIDEEYTTLRMRGGKLGGCWAMTWPGQMSITMALYDEERPVISVNARQKGDRTL